VQGRTLAQHLEAHSPSVPHAAVLLDTVYVPAGQAVFAHDRVSQHIALQLAVSVHVSSPTRLGSFTDVAGH
jgi:hypothetical protein